MILSYSSLAITGCVASVAIVIVLIVLVVYWKRRGEEQRHKRPIGKPRHEKLNYRMSSSSSCVTSSTTPSPKTTTTLDEHNDEQLTIICPVDEPVHKMLLSKGQPVSINQHHQLNLTQSSFLTSSIPSSHPADFITTNHIDMSHQDVHDDDDDDDDIFDPPPPMPTDFISTTSSNLDFLKTHSLFDSTPLNFYPQLGAAATSADHRPPPYSVAPNNITVDSRQSHNLSLTDYRFSTFVPSNVPPSASTTSTSASIFSKNREIF